MSLLVRKVSTKRKTLKVIESEDNSFVSYYKLIFANAKKLVLKKL